MECMFNKNNEGERGMKRTERNQTVNRICSVILSVMLAVNLLPVSVLAATTEHPGAVTVTVKDEKGNPLSQATVDYQIYAQGGTNPKKAETLITDVYGTVEVLPSSEYAAGDSISAEVSKAGYRIETVDRKEIGAAEEDQIVSLTSMGVSVVPANAVFSENKDGIAAEHDPVTVNGLLKDDRVTCTIDGKEYEDLASVPKISNAGTYPVTVKVERDGYAAYTEDVTASIAKADIDVSVTPLDRDYQKGKSEKALTVDGLRSGDDDTYELNSKITKEPPLIENAGQYPVTVRIHRNDNYNDFSQTYTAKIGPADIDGLSVKYFTGKYDGVDHEAVLDVEGTVQGDVIEYRKNDGTWSEDIPLVKEAGAYTIGVRVKRTFDPPNPNYKDITELPPATVVVEKGEQSIEFKENEYKQKEAELLFDMDDPRQNEFDFSAEGGKLPVPVIRYSVENDSEEDHTDIGEIAEIDGNGKLTIKQSGFNIKVTAIVEGDSNYNEGKAECHVSIPSRDKNLLTFDRPSVSYVAGTSDVISDQAAHKAYEANDKGAVSYSISTGKDSGIVIDQNTGIVTVKSYKDLCRKLADNGNTLTTVVTAHKAEGIKKRADGTEVVLYQACEITYEIVITFEELKSVTCRLMDPDGNVLTEANGEDGWFHTAVTVAPSDNGYTVAQATDTSEELLFDQSVEFNDQGTTDRKVYFRNKTTGGITSPVETGIEKLDSVRPDGGQINIKYPESRFGDRFLELFYDFPVTIEITAYDETSGIDRFLWRYTRDSKAGNSVKEKDEGTITEVRSETDSESGITKYIGQITLPKSEADQLRGYFSVSAIDKAGLASEYKSDEGKTIIVDTISPTQEVSFQLKGEGTSQTVGKRHYFSDDVEFTFSVEETNFFPEDVAIKVFKNGESTTQVENLEWIDSEDLHTAKHVLSDEGDYVVIMEYKDRMAHENGQYAEGPVTAYVSETVTIDKGNPEITFHYTNGNNTSAEKDQEQTAAIQIKEHNFRASDLEVEVIAKDINGSDIDVNDLQDILRNASWEQEGDVYTTTLSKELIDGIYHLTFNYKDLALNPAKTVETGEFIVDHKAPDISDMKISYSQPVMEKILSAITFGYYNPDVTVTFEARDEISGVSSFIWSYSKEDKASDTNVRSYENEKLSVEQDEKDKSKFTASVRMPKEEGEQLRGNVAFQAVDEYSNMSGKKTDTDHVIVVDTIAPQMTADYTEASRTVGSTKYYNKEMTATFTVTEANFYAEDVVVEVSKNGEEFLPVSPTWRNLSPDLHIGTCTIAAPADHSGDGDYIFRVEYTDRSSNEMAEYTSDTITVDTIKPVINVEYRDQNPVNTLTDTENHARKYFNTTQSATVTVNEHNFAAQEVDFRIRAKDSAGRELNADSLNSKSSWSTSGDRHVLTITYPGDANYYFDIDYTDLATNKADDYREDYFTVDKSAPESLDVSYSTSILDTILQGITFGFYNAPVEVTLTADDGAAGVRSFQYDCTRAEGVSSVNTELIGQAIDEADITYSDSRRTATTHFSIPRGALGGGDQFNGNVAFTAADRAGNESGQLRDDRRIVVDNISPTSTVTYSTPVQTANGIAYYDGPVNATVTVNEANFYAEDVKVSVTRDGGSYPVTPSWSDNSADVHVGTFTLSEDGDYTVAINYTDKSTNQMAAYSSEQLTVDTEIVAPVITVNGEEANGKAFKDDMVPAVSFDDINFESYEIHLTRTRYDEKDVDVTEQFIGAGVSLNENGGSGTFDTFAKEQDVDGIYTMTVTMADKAGHSIDTSATFTVNRFGSVYEYSDYLISLIKEGGAYVQEIEENLVIKEYNADRLVEDSLDIEILRDGKPLDEADYETSQQMNDQVSVGSSGWYQYEYKIDKDNFGSDGIYKIAVSSKDATGNSPETANYKDKNILFRVDSTPPEIESITGFEENIINAQDVTAKYVVYDTIGLASVKTYVDGKEVETVTDFKEDLNNYDGSFKVSEKKSAQTVRLVVEDLAGNVTDTDSDQFESAFDFNRSVTVSTDFFVRFLANRMLLWGTAAGVFAMVGVSILTITIRRKKRIGDIVS